MKETTATNAKLGKKGGASAGLESGIAEVKSMKAGQGIEVCAGTERAKPQHHGKVTK